jgi:hypothetical protein
MENGCTDISVLLFICAAGMEQDLLLLQPFIGLLYQPWMIDDDDDCGANSGINEC